MKDQKRSDKIAKQKIAPKAAKRRGATDTAGVSAKKITKKNTGGAKKQGATRKQGASRKAETEGFSIAINRNVLLSAVVSLFVGILGYGFYQVAPKVKTVIADISMDKEIRHLEIQGDFAYVERATVEQVISSYLKKTFFNVDIVELKSMLEQHPWIDRATVARKWPDTVKVFIAEQQPIARWAEKGFLNQRGDVILVSLDQELNHLPLLSGHDGYAREVMQQYLRINKMLWQSELALSELHLDHALAWTLKVQPEVEIKLGRDSILEKLQTLMNVKQKQFSQDFYKIDAIDMRYGKGFAVSWKESEINQVATLK